MEWEQFNDLLRQALETPEVRALIRQIAAEDDHMAGTAPAARPEQLRELEELNAKLRERIDLAVEERDALEVRLREEQRRNKQLTSQAEERERQLREARRQGAEWENQLTLANQRCTGLSAKLQEAEQQCKAISVQQQEALAKSQRMEEELKQQTARLTPLRPLLEHFDAYRALPGTLLKTLAPLLPADNVMGFWANGCQIDNILHLWDALKLQTGSLSPEHQAVILDILSFFLDRYNSVWASPVYQLMTQEVGRPFDDLRHLRSGDCSRFQGDVAQVLLPGIWNLNRNTAERKCLVRF